ncbi:MAG: tetratricopeptide repeat protein [Polyangiaceae bacterium]
MHASDWVRQVWISSLLVAGSMLAVGCAPLFGGPGYEAALAMGLIVPSVTAIASALAAFEERDESNLTSAVSHGIERGCFLAALAFLTMLVHGLRVGFCSFVDGSLLVLMGPTAGVILAGAWGGFSGGWMSRQPRFATRRWIVAVAFAAPLVTAIASLARFLTSPMVFAFDPFVGFFSGTLYDTIIDGTEKLLTYRIGTLGSVMALLLGARVIDGARDRWTLVGCLFGLTTQVAITFAGSSFGHWHTVASIKHELGGETRSRRCVVVHPRGMRTDAVALLGRDCDQDVEAVERYMGVSSTPPITVFLFQDASQKRALMGAADVYIAKPWRHEVYVQIAGFGGYPHPVLRHELAHVIAGGFARGPFKIAGQLGGVLPDPGLIEGIAEAASPDDDELTLEQWSKAMLELGLLPSLDRLFGTGFLSMNQSRAYTIAGAFVTWFHRVFGADALRRWYGGASPDEASGQPWVVLERTFKEHLRTLELPPEAMAIAKARFERPAVFGRHCPHEVDATRRRAGQLLAQGDVRGARALVDAVERDAPEPATWMLRATCRERAGDVDGAKGELEKVAAIPNVSRTSRDRADERLADLALVQGDLDDAKRRYSTLIDRSLDEDVIRTLEVKLLATSDADARAAIVPLLVGRPDTGTIPAEGAEETGRWAERKPNDGLPRYLLARAAISRGDWVRGAKLLDEALSREMSLVRVKREAARLRVIAGCAQQDAEAIHHALRTWDATGDPPGSRGPLLRELASRCISE